MGDGLWVRVGELATALRMLADAIDRGGTATVPSHGALRMACEGSVWTLEGLGQSCRVPSGRGVELLARLVARPHEDVHVLDLIAPGTCIDAGDSGELLDAATIAAYRARIRDCRAALDEAEQWNEPLRAERARAELEALETELARGVGLGGRRRRAGAAAERARTNVQRRVACAIRKIRELSPALGEHLARTIRTGTRCSYRPEPWSTVVACARSS